MNVFYSFDTYKFDIKTIYRNPMGFKFHLENQLLWFIACFCKFLQILALCLMVIKNISYVIYKFFLIGFDSVLKLYFPLLLFCNNIFKFNQYKEIKILQYRTRYTSKCHGTSHFPWSWIKDSYFELTFVQSIRNCLKYVYNWHIIQRSILVRAIEFAVFFMALTFPLTLTSLFITFR